MAKLTLASIDDQLLDGLEFCRRVYDLFDGVRKQPGGISRLRRQPTIVEKRLSEELIPIARYVQARYREGRRIKVRWLSGSQSYDAVLWSSGALVTRRVAPKKVTVEVTMSVHPSNHLARELLDQGEPVFGVKGIARDRKTKKITSKPTVFTPGELAGDLAGQIIGRLKRKSEKKYPKGTVLIIFCITNSLTLEDEWEDAVERVVKSGAYLAFREVFLVETGMSYSRTLYGKPNR